MTDIILNITQGNFFKCSDNLHTRDKILLDLLAPIYNGKRCKQFSHWEYTDRIVLVPVHLQEYVKKNYGEIFM